MRTYVFFSFFSLQLLFSFPLESSSCEYTLSGGRLGDNLLMYLRAKALATKYGLDLVYRPFAMSEQFAFHHYEQQTNNSPSPQAKHVLVKNEEDFATTLPTHFTIPYFSDFLSEQHFFKTFPQLYVDWHDTSFLKWIRTWVQPLYALDLIYPQDPSRKSVAVHFRDGSGFDDLPTKQRHPLKFPPIKYYINQIIKLHTYYNHPLEVFIFTDHKTPQTLLKLLQTALNDLDIILSARVVVAQETQTILEDLFSMCHFDCLIRTESSYSFLASLLKDFDIVIAPAHYRRTEKQIEIEAIDYKKKHDPFYTLQHESKPLS